MSAPPWRVAKNAFVPVPTRSTLGQYNGQARTGSTSGGQYTQYGQYSSKFASQGQGATTAPATASTQTSTGSDEQAQWPESLRKFVERCLSEVTPEDKAEMQNQLKQVITNAFEKGETWEIDWDHKSLPILEKRRAEKLKRERSQFAIEEDGSKREKRMKRFQLDKPSSSSSYSPASTPNEEFVDTSKPLVGRSTKLEKRYLRLTSEPDPETVRPLPVLRQTLELLKKKWKQEQNYAYICDQFKSLRQDLTVQHIQNEFTVQVYEIHARIALEKGDLGEYNQCQSQLKQLYAQGIPGNRREFLAYRVLYLLHTLNKAEIGHMLVTLEEHDRKDPAISHALRVTDALTFNNYHLFFKLYCNAPNMGGYVMDSFIERERLAALSALCRACRPTLKVAFLASQLAFQDTQEFVEFLQKYNVPIEEGAIDAKGAYVTFELARQNAYKRVDIKGQI
uniref:ARAD1C38742p n=1 Tax=Blastobotrys adeninivorans TaxID=409370 RepID=A0A060T3N9_BLAAD